MALSVMRTSAGAAKATGAIAFEAITNSNNLAIVWLANGADKVDY